MLMIGGGLLTGVMLVLTAAVYRQHRTLAWRLRYLTKKVARRNELPLPPAPVWALTHLLNPSYSLIRLAINEGDAKTAYQAVDLLKKCAFAGWIHIDEKCYLKELVLLLLKNRQPEIASQVLDIFNLAILHAKEDNLPGIARQVTIIGLAALKEKENFLAAKAIVAMHSILVRQESSLSSNCVPICLQGIEAIGLVALRRHDSGLFREIGAKLTDWVIKKHPIVVAAELRAVFLAWTYQIVVNGELQCLEILIDIMSSLTQRERLPAEVRASLFQEWMKLAGVAALNPDDVMAPRMIAEGLRQAVQGEDMRIWTVAVSSAGMTTAALLNRYGLQQAFRVLYPVLDTGRFLLKAELKFGGEGYADSYRQQALSLIVQESLILMRLLARQDMIRTVDEIITDVLLCWLVYPAAIYTRKQARKYCQLLYYSWRQSDRKIGRENFPADKRLIEPELLSITDRQQLKFLYVTQTC